jgi:GntR family transcriptional regulator, vanillate catabolism transcriptional regulator
VKSRVAASRPEGTGDRLRRLHAVSTRLGEIAPLERTRLVDEVTHRLRNLILDGTLVPGQRLLQTSLAEELGVSRTPLREALRVLQHEGFVEFVDGNKTLAVVDFSTDDLLEIYELREVVDGLAVRLAAQRGITRATGKRLHGALADFKGAVGPRAITRRAAAHADFHATIAQASGNRHVVGQIPMIRFTAQMGTRYVQNLDEHARSQALGGIEQGEGNHLAILQAIRAAMPARRSGRLASTSARRSTRSSASARRGPGVRRECQTAGSRTASMLAAPLSGTRAWRHTSTGNETLTSE